MFRANTAATPIWATSSPAIAGPMARARLMLIELRAAAAGSCSPRDHVRHQRLVGGRDQDGAGAQHKREHEQQRGWHPVRRGQHGERRAGGGHAGQDRDEQLDPVEDVRQHAAHQREQDGGQRVGGLDERDQDGRVSVVDHQPLGAHGLHPGAHVADQRRDPQRPEQSDTQRRPGRRSRSGRPCRVPPPAIAGPWVEPASAAGVRRRGGRGRRGRCGRRRSRRRP